MQPVLTRPKISFARTRQTLLERLARDLSPDGEAAWMQFFELYHPVMLKYAELYCSPSSAEDIVQDVFVKLVAALRERRYVPRPGVKFRTYLMTLIRNGFVDWRRHERAHGADGRVPVRAADAVTAVTAADRLDAEWRVARRFAATEHVLSQTALPDRMRQAYRLHVIEGRPVGAVAAALGIRKNYVSLAKSRISRRIASVEALYGD